MTHKECLVILNRASYRGVGDLEAVIPGLNEAIDHAAEVVERAWLVLGEHE